MLIELHYRPDTGAVSYCGQAGVTPLPGYVVIPCADTFPGDNQGQSQPFTGHEVWIGAASVIDDWLATAPQSWEILAVREVELQNQNRSEIIATLDAIL